MKLTGNIMPDTKIDISVIIPANNEEAYIAKSIESVLSLPCDFSLEVIVACNGCSDNTAGVAGKYKDVVVVESEKAGMSFGKNLGGNIAKGDILLFLDADTTLMDNTLNVVVEGCKKVGGEVAGTMDAFLWHPTFSEACLIWASNLIQRIRKLPTASGAIYITKGVYDKIGGFDETIPQGTSSALAIASSKNGAKWIYLKNAAARTSPRRFRNKGILKQMFSWVKNVWMLKMGKKKELAKRDYDEIR
jgi:glycosyltransferase involved in cell wall biosynthesis